LKQPQGVAPWPSANSRSPAGWHLIGAPDSRLYARDQGLDTPPRYISTRMTRAANSDTTATGQPESPRRPRYSSLNRHVGARHQDINGVLGNGHARSAATSQHSRTAADNFYLISEASPLPVARLRRLWILGLPGPCCKATGPGWRQLELLLGKALKLAFCMACTCGFSSSIVLPEHAHRPAQDWRCTHSGLRRSSASPLGLAPRSGCKVALNPFAAQPRRVAE